MALGIWFLPLRLRLTRPRPFAVFAAAIASVPINAFDVTASMLARRCHRATGTFKRTQA